MGSRSKNRCPLMGWTSLFSPFRMENRIKQERRKDYLENQLFEKGFGRDTCVIALGGGVVTDLAGYLAATYCRGIPLVMMPTTLLGMVDASIGGKTGVNVPYGKNLLGCFYPPKKVLIDPATLHTLPKKELANGFVEIIKYGCIADKPLFEYLEKQTTSLFSLEKSSIKRVIFESCRIKKEIVEQDEKDQGKRHLLNFGHTIGHALEHLTHYTLSHGEAVAIGLLVESYLSLLHGALDQDSFHRLSCLLRQYALPLKLSMQFSVETFLEAMVLDKKSLNRRPRFVMIEAIGSPLSHGSTYCRELDESLVRKALSWMNDALCRD